MKSKAESPVVTTLSTTAKIFPRRPSPTIEPKAALEEMLKHLGFAVTVRTDLCRAIDLGGSLAAMTAEMTAAGVTIA